MAIGLGANLTPMADPIDDVALLEKFAAAFPGLGVDRSPVVVVRAPGRVNLIGEHTDYNDGFVLPAAIDLETRVALVATTDRLVELQLASTAERVTVELDDIGSPRGGWIDYVAGVARSLMAAGIEVGGFKGVLASTLPISAGLSSSAALELAAAWSLLASGATGARDFDPLSLARLCQKAENEYVGVKSGLMDQFASSCGVAGHALLLDCRSLEHRPVAIPEGMALVVVDSGARRRLVASEYNERRAQCERGVAILAGRGEPVSALRDATVEMLDSARAKLGEETYRRCRHIVDENARTLAAVAALESGDRGSLGELFAASHASLRDLYEVSSPALDLAVEVAVATPGVVAARMTGAGFGGCTVNLVEQDAVRALEQAIARDYAPRSGLAPGVYRVNAVDGAGPVAGLHSLNARRMA
jgi:galactokinase